MTIKPRRFRQRTRAIICDADRSKGFLHSATRLTRSSFPFNQTILEDSARRHRLDCPAANFVPIAMTRVDSQPWATSWDEIRIIRQVQEQSRDHALRPARRRGCRRLAADQETIGEEDRRIPEDEIEHGLFPAGGRHGPHRLRAGARCRSSGKFGRPPPVRLRPGVHRSRGRMAASRS